MNIIYLGAFPPAFLVERTRGKIDSFYRSSEAIIRGLRSIDGVKLKVITSPDIVRFPKGPFFIKHETNINEDVTVVSMLNLPFIKQWWTIFSMTLESYRYIRKSDDPVVVIIPYIVFRHVFTLRLLHFLFPHKTIQACIVPDIFFPKSWRARLFNNFAEKMTTKFDCFVFYTEKMAEKLRIASDRYVVIEGFRTISNRVPTTRNDFRVVYAGSLNLNYGIDRLIEATKLIDDSDIFFHFYGSGDAENQLLEMSKKDPRIHFHGCVSKAKATDGIYLASVLINPRNANDGEYTAYSFPSKDIEYLATGIPTLLCKLPGMPCEYFGHFIDIKEGTPYQIAASIKYVKNLNQTEREAIGNDSRNFILDRMNLFQQAKKIISLFESVSNKVL